MYDAIYQANCGYCTRIAVVPLQRKNDMTMLLIPVQTACLKFPLSAVMRA